MAIRASENEVLSSKALSGDGPAKDITRQLTLKLSPSEIIRIFNAALKAKLLCLTAATAKPKKK